MQLTIEQHKEIIEKLHSELKTMPNGIPSYEWLVNYYSEGVYLLEDCPSERELVFKMTGYARDWAQSLFELVGDNYYKLFWEIVLFEARNVRFDSYMLYLEKNREWKDKYYEPRRKCFMKIGLMQSIQDMLDDKLDLLTISLPPSTGKSTLEKFLHSAVCGWYPDAYNLFYSHSGDITRMYYDGVYDILSNVDEYTWHEIFPNSQITNTNAKLEQINIDKYKPFPNVQCTSVGAKNAGKVRANFFLFCDDLIGGIEEALNRNQLDKLWNVYSVDARQRKYDGCKEIHIATRWSVHDVIGRLQRAYEGNPRARFLAFPDIDPQTGESNFMYDRDGFTVEFFHDQEMLMDDVSYRCLYKNEPIEREGLLYTEDSVRRYETLPDREPDAILGVCDAKGKGTDFLAMPIMYQYGEDYYMDDCICDNDSDYGRQYEKMTTKIIENNMQQLEIESNAGGDRVAFEVEKRVDEAGGRCNITTKATETNKETRIIVSADWVKKHVLFKAKNLYDSKSDYGVFMSQVFSYSISGKNPHDDACDSLSNFSLFVTKRNKKPKVATILRNFL